MEFLEAVTPPTAIYYGFPTTKAFWEENFTAANMTSCVRRNVGKLREIKNGGNYIVLDISYNIDSMENRYVTSS